MEELLREAACLGNLDAVQKLLSRGASINSQHNINGWTALHWACKRGHVVIVDQLLRNGADVNIVSCNGESVADVATEDQVLKILARHGAVHGVAAAHSKPVENAPGIVPNYLQNPTFPHYDVDKPSDSRAMALTAAVTPVEREMGRTPDVPSVERVNEPSVVDTFDSLARDMRNWTPYNTPCVSASHHHISSPTSSSSPHSPPLLLVKVRVNGSGESDFVEVEVAPPTYSALISACCEELELAVSEVVKIRKLPNILVRKDRDVQRMKDGQELEVVLG